MKEQGRTLEQIAAAMAQQFGDRPRQAWRHAHGWTQNHVADLVNELLDDEQAAMTGNRISDYERWPRKGGIKPTVYTLALLAQIYGTRVSDLVDSYDRQKMSLRDRIVLGVVDSVVTPQQLPATIPNFVGRSEELAILTAQLNRATAGGSAVVITSIGGTAGVGKTALASYWARTHSDQFPGGQLYVDLRGFDPSVAPMTPQEAIRSILDAFQVPVGRIPASFEAQVGLYRSLAEGKRLLIVLDNARDADQVWPLFPGSPRCLVLVTSRQQLAGLMAYQQATYITLELMSAEEAHELLTGILGAHRINADPHAVEALIQRCARLPLALTIAAARAAANNHIPLRALVDQLSKEHQRLDILSTGDSRKTDLRAVFSWSYTALSPQTARLFRLLGLHPGPDISTAATASLAGLPEQDTEQLLTELTQAHLLKEHTSGRYQFHDLLRAYATDRVTAEEHETQRRAALHRVLDYYLHTGVSAAQRLDPHRQPLALQAPQPGTITRQITSYEQALEWFTSEHAILLAIINHAATQKFDTHAWQLPWALTTFLNQQGHWHDYVATQRTALAAANRLNDRTAQAHALGFLGNAYTRLGHYAEAKLHLQQALPLYQELGHRTGQPSTHLTLALVCEQQGHYTEALTHAQHALDLYRTTDNHVWQANALNYIGWYQAQLGNYQQALTHCQQALNLHRKLGNRRGEANTLDSLGYAHHRLSQYEHALACYQQALTLHTEGGDQYGEAVTLTHLGDTHHTTGNDTAARQTWQQALTIFDQLDHPDADTIRAKITALQRRP
jgi:tetratricopeptide (TPR) repeat protein/transcriptional regulator with XRE-family HTH domain